MAVPKDVLELSQLGRFDPGVHQESSEISVQCDAKFDDRPRCLQVP